MNEPVRPDTEPLDKPSSEELVRILDASSPVDTQTIDHPIKSSEIDPGDDRNAAIEAPARLGRYRVVRVLGKGTYGQVLLARDELLGCDVAIKYPNQRLHANDSDAFLEEARAVAALSHPNIVRVRDVAREPDGSWYVVLDYIDGENLSDRLAKGPMPFDQVAGLLETVARALQEAHRKGFVHRDLKPANILLDSTGEPFVTDFGLALHESVQLSHFGEMAGTIPYMAPEQIRGEVDRLDGRCDIWSLGVILYEMLVRRRPFRAESSKDLTRQIEEFDPKPPRQLNDAIPKELERICLKALAKKPTDRYATASDFADDLAAWLENQSKSASSPAHGEPVAPATYSWAVGLGIIPFLALVAFLWWSNSHQGESPAIIRKLEVVHYVREGKDIERAVRLDGSPDQRVREGDSVRLEAELSQPAHVFVFTLDSNGKAQLRRPNDLAHPAERVDRFTYPSGAKEVYTLTDGEGVQGFLVVAAKQWPENPEAWVQAIEDSWKHEPHGGIWRFDGQKFEPLGADNSRGQVEQLAEVPPSLETVCQKASSWPEVVDVRAIAFPVRNRVNPPATTP